MSISKFTAIPLLIGATVLSSGCGLESIHEITQENIELTDTKHEYKTMYESRTLISGKYPNGENAEYGSDVFGKFRTSDLFNQAKEAIDNGNTDCTVTVSSKRYFDYGDDTPRKTMLSFTCGNKPTM